MDHDADVAATGRRTCPARCPGSSANGAILLRGAVDRYRRSPAVIDILSMARPRVRLGFLAVGVMAVAVACSGSDDGGAATEAPTEPAATDVADVTVAPAADTEADTEADTDPAADAGAPDFGSGTGSITLGDETFELVIGPGTGLCRDVFGMIQAGGEVADGRDIEGDISIPPLDWESYDDGRYDPPSVELKITSTGDDNASWVADAGWAAEFDKVGLSQVDSYEKDGSTASGTVTFANAWDPADESVQGSFEVSCEA